MRFAQGLSGIPPSCQCLDAAARHHGRPIRSAPRRGAQPGITQIKIVEQTGSDPNTVAAILRLLERRGLVRRRSHAIDRRARCVFLTTAGRSLERRTFKYSEPLRVALRDCLTESESDENQRFLERVHEVFSAPPFDANGRTSRRLPHRKGVK